MKKNRVITLLIQLCLLVSGLLGQLSLKAQCTAGSTKSITYDTLIAGSGNDNHTFSFSKFNPALGTLLSAKASAVVSVNYGFVLKNVESVSRNFSVSVGRYDYFQSSTSTPAYNNVMETSIGTYHLDPGNMVSQPLANIIYRYVNTDSVVTNVAEYMGAGNVSFDYEPITYTNLLGSANYYYSASASDTVHFSITYLYCNATVLPASLTRFTAVKENGAQVKLAWETVNDEAGTIYEIQESADGNNFSTVGTVPASFNANNAGTYLYHYNITNSDKGKLYFRLNIKSISGNAKYSEIRVVDIGNETIKALYIYPNPADAFINIEFSRSSKKDWQVDIISSNGSVVQHNSYHNTNTARINFLKKLAAGVYCVRALDPETQKIYVSPFVIR